MSNAVAGYDLTGQVAVLTGAGSGIGKATALTLAGAGATIVGGDIDEDAVNATADEITDAGGTARAVVTDVTQPRGQVDALVDGAQSEFGRVDIMGNIAGIPHNKMFMEVTDEDFERILSINLKSCVYGCQAATAGHGAARVRQHHQHLVGRDRHARADARLLRHDEGRGRDAHQDAGLRGRAARDPGERPRPRRDPHQLLPPQLRGRERQRDPREGRGVQEALRRAWPRSKRVGEAQDVADSILFLVSEGASFMTGQILRPNGGVAMPW